MLRLIFGLFCLISVIRHYQANIDLSDSGKQEIKQIFQSLDSNHQDDSILHSWFPLSGLKIRNKVVEDEKIAFGPKKFIKSPFKRKFSGKNVCNRPECVDAGVMIRANLNESVDPCEDFYEFACGGWIHDNRIPATASHYSQFDLVDKKLKNQLRDILESDPDVMDPLPVQAAQLAYKTCVDSEQIEMLGTKPLVIILDSLGGWPLITPDWNDQDFDISNLFVHALKRWSIRHLFYIYVNVDRMNSSKNIITIDQGATVLPRSMMVDPSSFPKQIEAYSKWIIRSASILKDDSYEVENSSLEKEAHEIVKFEMNLAKLTNPPEMRRDATRMRHIITVRHLTDWTDSASGSDRSRIDWLGIINSLFNGTGISINSSELVNVKEYDYLFYLVQLIETTPPRVLANYMIWRIVKSLSYEMTDSLRQLSYDFEHIYAGSTEPQPRWHDCVDTINDLLGFAVGYKYVKLHFNERHKKVVEEVTNNMKIILRSRLSSLSWMDSDTRSAALDKLEAMKEFIGYPNWYNNLTYFNEYFAGISISEENHLWNIESLRTYSFMKNMKSLHNPTGRKEWPISPAVVNAYNNIQMNTIIFPAGILQSPFFSLERPESLNYGSIGIIIGHEIMHGFDDMGRQNDKFGNIVQWWSDQTLETYKQKAQCFVSQYSQYRIPELDSQFNTQTLANGVSTQGENIADNGGLEMGYLAYKKYVAEHGEEPRLPGLEQYSPEQLFFIGYASNWCESVSKESLLEDLLSGVHSTQRLRVIGAVSNSEQFAKAFSCKIDSRMNPDDKCSIW